MNTKFNIGIDFGGVLSIHDDKNTNMFGLEHRNTAINMPFAHDALSTLKKLGHNLYLISFCGKNRAIETRKSIEDSEYSNLLNSLYFVKGKPYKDKLCQYLGCHFVIDDSVDVLDNIKVHNDKIVTILFDADNHSVHKCAKDWYEVLRIINETEYFEPVTSTLNISKYLY